MTTVATCILLLCFAVSAEISGVHFSEGSFVKEGAVLFALNSSASSGYGSVGRAGV
ncbi:MAG: hypothetical protein IJS39_07775 [Synergistaceae bacterium]|nr:hypothetical protein [Synergistaceae bacterium]